MRTTVILPDELYRQVKERARAEERTITSFMEDALRRELGRTSEGIGPVDVFIAPPFPGNGVRPGVDLTSSAALLDVMDEGEPVEKLR